MADAKLSKLAISDAYTETLALLPGSPAINAGDNAICTATDQRGMARPQAIHCDIGAHESSLLADQRISFNALPSKMISDAPFNVSTTASSGLSVAFTASGGCTINAAVVTLTGQPGDCTITAHQTGDGMDNPAADVAQSFTVNGAQTTGFNLFLPVVVK